MKIIDSAFDRARVVLLAFFMLLIAGTYAYIAIPKEAEPDVPIPMFYVSISHQGISPEDADRLLARPMEKELQSLEGLKEMRSTSSQGYVAITLEFHAGFDSDKALLDIREKVDLAKSKLPLDTEEPRIIELNIALFPVISVVLSGSIPENRLVNIAKDLKDKIEAISGVLEADIGGDREEMLEIVIDPSVIENYKLSFSDIISLIQNNNRLVAAGAIDTGYGRMVIKVPGVIEDITDVMSIPIKTVGNTVVTFKDVAKIHRSFKEPNSFARIKGESAVVLEVSKRLGANIIETIEKVRAVVEQEKQHWPQNIKVNFMQDKSEQIKEMLHDLQNNVLSAIILVMVIIIAALGVRPALLVGLSIPGSFLAGILIIYSMGFTINIVVLFSLILVVGMLVDGSIVTIELAQRKIDEGLHGSNAYISAAKRMAWPVIASTITTLVVFLPLLFWPGIVGEFMKYLPITVICTLLASLFMALIFIPVLGGITSTKKDSKKLTNTNSLTEEYNENNLNRLGKVYLNILRKLLNNPAKTFFALIIFLFISYFSYLKFGKGVEFFPNVEPDFMQVQVQARGDLSIYEKDALVRKIEQRLLNMDVFKSVYARTFADSGRRNMPKDTIGVIQLEFINWRLRPKAEIIIDQVRNKLIDIPGIKVQVRKSESGPSSGKPIEIELKANDSNLLKKSIEPVRELMEQIGGFVDIEDDRPLMGVEWRLQIDRKEAAIYGADVTTLGNTVQMLTTGLKLTEYRPDDSDDELDIRIRFPNNKRTLDLLSTILVPTANGQIPIKNFVTFTTTEKTGDINRVNGQKVMTIKADVKSGLLVDNQLVLLKKALAKANLDSNITISFKGQEEDQNEASSFLSKAFLIAIFLMTTILLTQFNSFYQTIVILSAIIFSTAGVLLGLLITGNPFSIVMSGLGIISLAGIVVNNNIILIDTYNIIRKEIADPMEAILKTASQRIRPVLLTSITTVLGLLPMVFKMNIDLINADVSFGSPSTQWWVQLASSIAGGLTFATILTLFLTPCLLMLGCKLDRFLNFKK